MPLARATALLSALAIAAGPAVAGLAAPAPAGASTLPGAVVRAPAGTVKGAVALDHRAFRGIPYAAPPTGANRFRPPRPAARWTGERAATTYGRPCPQTGITGDPGDSGEDCLTLDVVTPPAARAKRLPVMVWFYGGAYVSGAGRDYVPTTLVTGGDVVVVTMNYRVGPFGFLTLPGLPGNQGLLDQQAGLRWVRDNVAAFGGDPGNVTIFGQSAGGNAVCQQLVSPTAKGLFHRAISQSGGCSGDQLEARPAAEARRLSREYAEAVGCTAAATRIACLRGKSVPELLAARGAGLRDAMETLVLPWTPSIDATVPLPFDRAVASGRWNAVPLVVGTTRDEGRYIVAVANHLIGLNPTTEQEFRAWAPREYGARAPAILAEYDLRTFPSPDLASAQIITDETYACSASVTRRNAAAGARVWAYEYDDENVPLEGIDPFMPLGAYHGVENYYLFSSVQGLPTFFLDPWQQKLSRQMIDHWTTFARTGDPNTRSAPAWPSWTPSSPQVQKLTSAGSRPITTFDADHRCAFWAAHPGG